MDSSMESDRRDTQSAPSVCVVVVNWNKKQDLLRLLTLLHRLDYSHFKIVVVDNASNDGSPDAVREAFPSSVTLLETGSNLGGTGGFNVGMDYGIQNEFDFLWLLDNDAIVETDSLKNLVSAALSSPEVGIVGSRILNAEDPSFLVKLGANIDWKYGHVRSVMQNARDREMSARFLNVDYVPFCSALISRRCVLQTGPLDERFFLYWDDSDFCIRAGKAGFRTIVALSSRVYHPSFTEKGRSQNYYLVRNTFLFFAKHLQGLNFFTTISHVLSRFFKMAVFAKLTDDSQSYAVIKGGVFDFLYGRFGRIVRSLPSFGSNVKSVSVPWDDFSGQRVIVTTDASVDVVRSIVKHLLSSKSKSVTVAVPDSRLQLLNDLEVDFLVLNDSRSNLFTEHVRMFVRILRNNYDSLIISQGTSPFGFACRHTFLFDPLSDHLSAVSHVRKRMYVPVLSLLLSYILLVLVLPFVLWRGHKICRKDLLSKGFGGERQ
ncbi:hypothetical protein C2E25_15150 [Geothermobacter hydrogeniphilus]|uniref:Glycosyltransferase, GT2 family n=1 Tax=Geothermobacter hydrogeniphilus TaxID=1969733 RepID=A0A2K2H6L8_9BACT|nr:glycosyltransferase family 2 protein [Geothermobacter hydrogeniphilus]PNU18899.1 hypothetical protein C2E25_15150 [Geothermobacter hydrogeniphilus]